MSPFYLSQVLLTNETLTFQIPSQCLLPREPGLTDMTFWAQRASQSLKVMTLNLLSEAQFLGLQLVEKHQHLKTSDSFCLCLCFP